MKNEDIEIKGFDSRYMKGIIELENLERGLNLNDDFIRWIEERPTKDIIGYVALHENKVIGFYICISSLLSSDKGEVVIYQGASVVNSSYRQEGIYSKLAERVRDELKKRHTGTYELVSKIALKHLTKKCDFDFLGYTNKLVRPLNTKFILERMIKNEFIAGILAFFGDFFLNLISHSQMDDSKRIGIRKIKSFDERIDGFWKKALQKHEIMLVRNKEHLNWRFVMNPVKKYDIFLVEENKEIVGYFVLSNIIYRNAKYVIIEDILGLKQEDVITAIISDIIRYAKEKNSDMIVGQFTDPYYIKIIKKSGFFGIRGQPIVVKTHYKDTPKDIFLDKRKWFITHYNRFIQ